MKERKGKKKKIIIIIIKKCGYDPKTSFVWVAALSVKNKCNMGRLFVECFVSRTAQ
jgi:hypothetical protein